MPLASTTLLFACATTNFVALGGRMTRIRVLIVDDSSVIRRMMVEALSKVPQIEVVGEAASGETALELLPRIGPDVITLDVQMPGADGLETLDAIMARSPRPVIMVSGHTRMGAQTTLDALERGAVDYVAKPESPAEARLVFEEELPRKIRAAAVMNMDRLLALRRQRLGKGLPPRSVETSHTSDLDDKCIAIGVSTGGPPALSLLLERLAPPMPPIVIVQHMPPGFTRPFAWRLNSISALTVREAESGDLLCKDQVLIAPGGAEHLVLAQSGRTARVTLRKGDLVSGHRPSVDVMMRGAAASFGNRCLGIIMTGMGRDGVEGCRAIREAGGFVLGQGPLSSDVYGMNKAAFDEGHVDEQFELEEGPVRILAVMKRLWGRAVQAI